MTLNLWHTIRNKINSNWILVLNIRIKTTKYLVENISKEYLWSLDDQKNLKYDSKSINHKREKKKEHVKLIIKIQNSFKKISYKNEETSHRLWENIFVSYLIKDLPKEYF